MHEREVILNDLKPANILMNGAPAAVW